MANLERFCFLVRIESDWFDLFFYVADRTIEMYDVKQKRTFLKRTKSDLRLEDLHVNASVNVFSRQTPCARTMAMNSPKSVSQKQMERALVIVKPEALKQWGAIVDELIQHQFTICNMRMQQLNRGYKADQEFQNEVRKFGSGPSVSIEVMRASAIPELDRIFGESSKKGNSVFYTTSTVGGQNDAHNLFSQTGKKHNRTAKFKNSTLALIRPHAIQFEFLEIYKGVVPEYHLMLDQLTSGPCPCTRNNGTHRSHVSSFREFVGPTDPTLAKTLLDKVKNAIHCTDLEEMDL
ncbi:hypothetical protein BC829DRAFT_404312 [Chytridium lagenaria]|nr:hypothetical protein BC829DRAFT_404312 [Chytridium lagenaria]